MSTVAAPADRRFRRAHLKPARSRRHWRVIVKPVLQYSAAAIAIIYGAYRLASAVAYAPMLRIDRVVVRGNERLSQGEVLAVLGGLQGENILSADLDLWRRRLLASPWVRDAALRRSLPSTVDVAITERQPMGIARINGDMYLVDSRGVVIDQYGPQYADFDMPIVDGLAAAPGSEMMTDESRADLASRVIAALKVKPAVARRLSQVDVTDLHNASVILTGDPAIVQIGEDQFLARVESYIDVAAAVRERVADVDYVDLRFDDRIYVRPAAKRAREARPPAARRGAKR